MKVCVARLAGVLMMVASAGAGELADLRQRCAEQERQIRDLEVEVSRLRSLLERHPEEGVLRTGGGRVLNPNEGAAAAGTAGRYTVRPGDTLSRIARRLGTSVDALAALNGLQDSARIQVGTVLKVPAAAAPSAAPPATPGATPGAGTPAAGTRPAGGAGKVYTVKAGDTCYRIARLHATTIDALLAANPGLDPARLRVGQQLRIDPAEPAPRSTPAAAIPAPGPPTPAAATTPKEQPAAAQPAAKPAAPPAPKPATPPAGAEKPAAASFRLVRIAEPITVGEFAARHGATVEQLSELNGQELAPSLLLAKDSELYIPVP